MPSATLTCHGLTHLVDSNWLSNMPYHQNAVLHSYTHTMGLHTIPDKCYLQWNNKYGYNLPYKTFIPDISWLNWSCLCCTPLMHHTRYIRLKRTRTGRCSEDTTSYTHKTEFATFCTKLNDKYREFLSYSQTSWCTGKCVWEKLYQGPLLAVRKESIFITGIKPASCQAIGIKFSDHIQLHMDWINIGGRWDSTWLWILWGQETSYDSNPKEFVGIKHSLIWLCEPRIEIQWQ
jgi:hypothetical protein